MTDEGCVAFLQWCLPRLGLRWPGYRKVRRTVCKRVRRRCRELDLDGLEAYRRHLEADADEWRRLDAMCRIPVSRFYRDKGVFQRLARDVLPGLAAQAGAEEQDAVRVWSAGAASGEEPYTLAILWALGVAPGCPGVGLDILATDADETLLARAAAGRYRFGSLKELPEDWRRSAFERSDEEFRLRPEFRTRVEFRREDIRRRMPAGPFDLVLCRNLAFTYFEAAVQADILAGIASRLAAGAILVIGAHESLPEGAGDFQPLKPGEPIYAYGP